VGSSGKIDEIQPDPHAAMSQNEKVRTKVEKAYCPILTGATN